MTEAKREGVVIMWKGYEQEGKKVVLIEISFFFYSIVI